MADLYAQRRSAVRRRLDARGLGALVVTHPVDAYYLTGFTGESGAVVVGRKSVVVITDGRFRIQARDEVRGAGLRLHTGSVAQAAGEWLKQQRVGRVGYDPDHMSVAQLRAFRRAAKPGVRWAAIPNAIEDLRALKAEEEIGRIRAAARVGDDVMRGVLQFLRPGVREFEVAGEIEYQMRKRGASGPAFETIVAFGERAALPHARPTARRLRKNELVVLDLGAILGHYSCDITRTVFVGKAPARVQRWYQAVLEAQQAAIEAARAGVACSEVDAAARGLLERHGLGKYFVHSTGHGLGLEVHEAPRLACGQKQVLQPGHVVTIEPGIYVEGAGGVRIEDDVAIHAGRTEVLTCAPRHFIEL